MTDKGVIWDLDGVLADTGEAHFQAWTRVLSERRIPFDRSCFDRVFGMNNRGTLTELLGRAPTEEELREIADRKELLFRKLAGELVRPMPGALRLLDELEKAGWPQAVASSAPQENIDLVVDTFNIRHYFAAILSGAGLPKGKPDPALFLQAARELGLPPERCVVVEDAPVGVEAAHRADMPCIAVATTRPKETLGSGPVFDDLQSVTVKTFSDVLRAGPGT
ncbi:MAG: HAD-IA family hydrolase [Deltaproteobacteria bacterium]|nr:HAD-IA family hydrolase [Deltaproteobacteria bacterium]